MRQLSSQVRHLLGHARFAESEEESELNRGRYAIDARLPRGEVRKIIAPSHIQLGKDS